MRALRSLRCVRCTAFDCYSAALRMRLQGCVDAVLGTAITTLHTRLRRWYCFFLRSNVKSFFYKHLFAYWLAEQRSPVLAVGLISFSSVLSLALFCKTRTIKACSSVRLPSLPYVVGGDCFAPGGGARRGVDPGGGGLRPKSTAVPSPLQVHPWKRRPLTLHQYVHR